MENSHFATNHTRWKLWCQLRNRGLPVSCLNIFNRIGSSQRHPDDPLPYLRHKILHWNGIVIRRRYVVAWIYPDDTGTPHTNSSLQAHPLPQLPSPRVPSTKCTKQATVLPPQTEPNSPATRATAPSSEHLVYALFSKSVSPS